MDYKETVFLPKTTFPMKANLANREPGFLEHWHNMDLYKTLREKSAGRSKFILHFGPPYANGHIHIGHALTETLKDVVNKIYQMSGFDAPMVPGWDCHGLPIEWKIEEKYRAAGQNKDDVDMLVFREECREFASKWIAIQKEEFKRLGIVADWDHPYSTMDYHTEAEIVAQLGTFLTNDLLYRGLKPVLWSVVEKTALAEAEVEYKDHTSDSIYVSFPVTSPSLPVLEGVEALIWTTTPWTLPGNRAIAYGEDFDYTVIHLPDLNKKVLIAKDLTAATLTALGNPTFEVTAHLSGKDLAGTICAHPMAPQGYTFNVPLLPGDHVTLDAGTGLVHTAPGHGLEDFEIGQKFNLEVPETVGPDGRYYEHVPHMEGIHIFKANPVVIECLTANNRLLMATKLFHSYPHSWRSKAPLIYRATAQWFIAMEPTLRTQALEAIKNVSWFPASGENRITAMVDGRPDWCISRQRAWGTPITVFLNKKTGQPLRDPAVHQRIVDAVREQGGDAWFTTPSAVFLGDTYAEDDYEKVTDILDVWFDSGCSQAFLLKNRSDLSWPADLYLEGSDQHRGWFQASLLVSCGTTGQAPYKKVMTHGFTLDEKGYKMSKSQGNVVAPEQIISTLGADILRLWIVSVDYSEDMRIGPDILKQQEDIYRRLRNTMRYLLGALDGFSNAEKVSYEDMPSLEKWILHRLHELSATLEHARDNLEFSAFYAELHEFCAIDLSAFYFDIRKDCLYCDAPTSLKRRAVRTVMDTIFNALCLWLAPVLSFTTEEAWQSRYAPAEDITSFKDSVHLHTFLNPDAAWHNPDLATTWETVRTVRRVITGALEVERAAKTIGSSLQATVAVYVPPETARVLRAFDMAELSITSDAVVMMGQPPAGAFMLETVDSIGVVVNQASGQKCARCWKVLPEVVTVCERCEKAVAP